MKDIIIDGVRPWKKEASVPEHTKDIGTVDSLPTERLDMWKSKKVGSEKIKINHFFIAPAVMEKIKFFLFSKKPALMEHIEGSQQDVSVWLVEPTKEFSFGVFLSVGRLSVKNQVLFAKRLSFLIGAGIPVLDSLRVLLEQTSSRTTKKILSVVIKDVANGRFLSGALERFKRYFGEFAINIIRVGESSGTLAKNLAYLATELEKKEALRKKVVSALVYPSFITAATLGITGLLTVYIFPKILPVFNSVAVELPWTTQTLIGVSDFLKNHGLMLLMVLCIVGVVSVILHRNVPAFRMLSDWCMLRLPVSGIIMQYYNVANFTRTLGLLLKSGVPVVEAADTTALTTRNRVYRAEIKRTLEHVKRGERISEHFKRHPGLFPPTVSHMVYIGEKTGNLSETLVYLSDHYEAEVDTLTKNLSSVIEPVLMIFMGLLVGFVAVSVITPIYEITQSISERI